MSKMQLHFIQCEVYLVDSFVFVISALLLLTSNSFVPVYCSDDSITSANLHQSQNTNHLYEYFHTLKRSQDEIFRKLDWLTKTVEEKDHEDYKFRLKFSRKVHTLENKVHYLEQTLTQKVEEVVQNKLTEITDRLRYQYQLISSSSHGSSTSSSSGANANNQYQSHQPYITQNRYPSQPYLHSQHLPYQNQNNYGFYEHPITQKKVRDSNFGFEPPTRNLPLISIAAAATSPSLSAPLQSQSRASDVKGSSNVIVTTSTVGNVEDHEGLPRERSAVLPNFEVEAQRKFGSLELTLQSLRENVTFLGKEISRALHFHNKDGENREVHRLLAENSKEVNALQQKQQEVSQRMEYFSSELGKAASAVNESLKEMSSEMKRQISSMKRQVHNLTTLSSSQTPDKLKCAQTLLDEFLVQLSKSKGRYNPMAQSDLFADQADNTDQNEPAPRYAGYNMPPTMNLTSELRRQRQEIAELKAEIARLNISQILLLRTVDQETLKRTVRPRACSEIRLLRNVSSGIYSVFPRMNDLSTDVYCDMQSYGGGWTVISRRGSARTMNESRESFVKTWEEYEAGFGSLEKDFWLGLSDIAALCQSGEQELRVELTNWSGETRYANYRSFKISNASDLYRLSVSGYKGTAGDSLTRHNGMVFSTPDKDHDTDPRRHCAKTYQSGWWYYACFESNLNGIYMEESNSTDFTYGFGTGIIWQHWMGSFHSLQRAEMKIRNTYMGENHYINLNLLSPT